MGVELQGPWRRGVVACIALALIAIFGLRAVHSLQQKSVTTDELMYVAAGHHHWATGSFEFNRVNPPLMKLVAGLPLLALDLERPALPGLVGDPSEWAHIDQWRYSRAFLYENRASADRILLFARLPVVALGMLLAAYVFAFAARLYGPGAGLVALALATLSPNLLAHARLATLDLGVALFMTACLYHFWRLLERPGPFSFLACGAALSAAMLSKTTGWFLLPILGVAALLLAWRGEGQALLDWLPGGGRLAAAAPRLRAAAGLAGALLALGLVALLGLNLGYAFEGTLRPLGEGELGAKLEKRVGPESPWRGTAEALLAIPSPVPRPFVDSVVFQLRTTSVGNRVFFSGESTREGFWYLMPAAFLLKTPLPALLLAAAGVLGALRRGPNSGELLLLLGAAFTFAVFFVLTNVSVGVRYLLPVYPLLHVLASRPLRSERPPGRWRTVLVCLLLAWNAATSLWLHPHYLAHFNELAGGPRQGWRWLADSHLDWGQDLPALRDWMEEKGVERVALGYFGSGDALHYGIEYRSLPSIGLAPRGEGERWWYEGLSKDMPPLAGEIGEEPVVVSATLLAGIFFPGYYEPLRGLEPVDQIGFSLLVFDPAEAKRAAREAAAAAGEAP